MGNRMFLFLFFFFFLNNNIHLLPSAAGPNPVALHVDVVAGSPELVPGFNVGNRIYYFFLKK